MINPNELLYHYTSQDGIKGIIENKCVWATNIHYLNDEKEFIHSFEIANTISWHWAFKGEHKLENKFHDVFKSHLERHENIHIFVASFTENGDLLSQWRGYCPNGCGYSIGFEKSFIEKKGNEQYFSIIPVVYDYKAQREIIEKIFYDTIVNYLSNYKTSELTTEIIEKAISKFFPIFIRIAPTLKNQAFSEEKEWRLVSDMLSVNDPRICFRAGKSNLIPYICVNLECSENFIPTKRVVIGPNPNKHLAGNSLAAFFHKNKIKEWSTAYSNVPYKNW